MSERVGAAIESVIFHRVNNQEDAEWIAKLIGAAAAWETTSRTDGLGLPIDEGTRTRGYRFEVNPADLQRLRHVARVERPAERRAERVAVVSPWVRLACSAADT